MIKPTTWTSANERVTSLLVPIQNNHYIVVENTSGTSRDINILQTEEFGQAIVIEQAP